jgi:hypothetical protein
VWEGGGVLGLLSAALCCGCHSCAAAATGGRRRTVALLSPKSSGSLPTCLARDTNPNSVSSQNGLQDPQYCQASDPPVAEVSFIDLILFPR